MGESGNIDKRGKSDYILLPISLREGKKPTEPPGKIMLLIK